MERYMIFISFFIIGYLLIKNSNLKTKNTHLEISNERYKNNISTYFMMLLHYRNELIKNNINPPNIDIQREYNIPSNIQENKNNKEYTVDSILDEIAEKGIDNISEDKLNFLKNDNDYLGRSN